MSVVKMGGIFGSGTVVCALVVYGIGALFWSPTLPYDTADGRYVLLKEDDSAPYSIKLIDHRRGESDVVRSYAEFNPKVLSVMPGDYRVRLTLNEFGCYGAWADVQVSATTISVIEQQRNPSCQPPDWLVDGAVFRLFEAPKVPEEADQANPEV
ncbi:hypothetical protein EXN22_23450 [Pseudomonas tructae]|uniref:Uncharacterized protein n=1 Tax=Pseudomonas tructae TaxID=2518644 RepID=A0A411MNV6_9PSED|nr:hypothetical protein [Pseudomonas tructae]QBF28502.1 hypothetical protein EXN22_23450 [Pseudomonas tructae]